MTTLKENKAPPVKNKSYEERKQTLKKKASELATLCDVPVCLVCVNPDGSTETWPEEEERVVDVLMAYKAQTTLKNESKVRRARRRLSTRHLMFLKLGTQGLSTYLRSLWWMF